MCTHIYIYTLVGGFNHLDEWVNGKDYSHILWKNKKCSKPPISIYIYKYVYMYVCIEYNMYINGFRRYSDSYFSLDGCQKWVICGMTFHLRPITRRWWCDGPVMGPKQSQTLVVNHSVLQSGGRASRWVLPGVFACFVPVDVWETSAAAFRASSVKNTFCMAP